MKLPWAACALALGGSVVVLAACNNAAGQATQATPAANTDLQKIAELPLGDVAGAAQNTADIPNPYAHDPQAVQDGHQLFIQMNCAGCHGYDAKGGMGPNLTDTYWRYGGVPVALFKSIYEGRPQGMPAWNPVLPPDVIWKLVAYIQSLGGTLDASQAQAWLQGDHPLASATPPAPPRIGGNPQEHSAPRKNDGGPPDSATRPDAGGTPPGTKP